MSNERGRHLSGPPGEGERYSGSRPCSMNRYGPETKRGIADWLIIGFGAGAFAGFLALAWWT